MYVPYKQYASTSFFLSRMMLMPSQHAHALKLLLKNRLETRFDDVQATHVCQNDSVPRRDKSSSKVNPPAA